MLKIFKPVSIMLDTGLMAGYYNFNKCDDREEVIQRFSFRELPFGARQQEIFG